MGCKQQGQEHGCHGVVCWWWLTSKAIFLFHKNLQNHPDQEPRPWHPQTPGSLSSQPKNWIEIELDFEYKIEMKIKLKIEFKVDLKKWKSFENHLTFLDFD